MSQPTHQPGMGEITPAGGSDEKKNVTGNVGAEEASMAMKPDHMAVTNSYDVDPFATNHEAAREDYMEFRTMGWLNAGLIGTAEGIALGLLSFPSIFERLGIVGGVIGTVGLAILAYLTCWIMVDFKVKHMGVMNYGDAMGVVFGKWGRRFVGTGVVIKSMGLAGSHVLVGQKALNAISDHAICGVWFGLIIMLVSALLSYNREWSKLHVLSTLSVGCILTAAMIIMIAVGVQDESVLRKGGPPIHFHAFPQNPSLINIIGGLTNIVFAYCGSLACFTLCSEMKRPNDFKKSFVIVQGSQAVTYVVVGAVVYVLGGQYVQSPALTMATHTVVIVAYAFALVTIIISGILGTNIGTKYLYVSVLRDSPLLTSKGTKSWLIWMAMNFFMWIVGFLVSQLIPFFNQLLTIISSLFSVWFIYGYTGFLFMYDNLPAWGRYAGDFEPRAIDTPMKKLLLPVAIFSIILSIAITPLGMYSAVMGIKDGYTNGTFSHPFSC